MGQALARADVEQLYRRHGAAVERRAAQILGNDDEAREAMQEVFVTLLTKSDRFDGRSALTTWLYSVTTRLCLNRLRDAKRRREILRDSVAPAVALNPKATLPEGLCDVRGLLRRVPENLARVAIYHYFDDLTQEEIAGLEGCSRRKVGYLLERFHRRAEKIVARDARREGRA